ncbi:MAG: hypothetical protein U9N72_10175 [Bacteroidota bacterium]|nr:hypothetical protein [Bacteroidota bacterium]
MKINRKKFLSAKKSDLIIVEEEYPDHSFFYINLNVKPDDDSCQATNDLSSYLEDNYLEVLIGFAFGFDVDVGTNLINDSFNKLDNLILLQDSASTGSQIQLICADGREVKSLNAPTHTTVKMFNHYGSELYYISNIRPNKSDNCYMETFSSFKSLGKILNDNYVSYNNLVRTWLYIHNILDWYDILNKARTDFFTGENIFEGLIPSSTGIGLSNIYKKCLSLSAFALKPKDEKEMVQMVDSPMQCDAINYKSSFSRAVEISLQTSKRLIISGTASIGSTGETLYKESVVKQIEHTMEVVKSILRSKKYNWDDIVRAIAYFPDPGHVKHFKDYCLSKEIDPSYFLSVGGTVCRDDLMFEIEIDAVKPLMP